MGGGFVNLTTLTTRNASCKTAQKVAISIQAHMPKGATTTSTSRRATQYVGFPNDRLGDVAQLQPVRRAVPPLDYRFQARPPHISSCSESPCLPTGPLLNSHTSRALSCGRRSRRTASGRQRPR